MRHLKEIFGPLWVLLLLAGCTSYYDKTGIAVQAGDIDAPIEVSDASGTVTVRALFTMTGVRAWTEKGNALSLSYRCASTNRYFWGMIEDRDWQDVTLHAEPKIDETPSSSPSEK